MDHKVSKDMISSGMIPSGEKTQADLGRTQYGSAPSPSSLMEAYRSIYEHHQKDKDGNTIPHQEDLNEGKMPEGLKNYLMKKGKKEDKKDVKEENLEERRGSSVQQLAANRKAAFTQKVAPQGGRGGGVGNPTNKRGTGGGTFKFEKPTGAAQGRTRRPTSTPTPVKTSSMGGRVGGGNAGASTNSGGTTMSTVRTVTTSTPTTTTTSTPTSKPTPKPSVQQRAQSAAKDRIASGKSISQVKAANKQSMRDRARDRFAAFKARRLMSDVDLFDIVKGQLIDEGYEEKEVIKIMINLSEDQLNELLGGRPGDGYIGHPNLKIKNPLSKQQITKPVMTNAQGGGLINRTAGQLGDRKMQLQKMMQGL